MIKVKDYEGLYCDALWSIEGLIGEELVEKEEKVYQMLCSKCYIHIPKLNLNIHNAFTMFYDDDIEDYELDNNAYLFFDSNTKDYLYSQQGSSLEVCILDYLKTVDKEGNYTVRKIGNLDCDFVVDKGKMLNSYHLQDCL